MQEVLNETLRDYGECIHRFVKDTSVARCSGAYMLCRLEQERNCLEKNISDDPDMVLYTKHVCEMFKTVSNSLLSAAHREKMPNTVRFVEGHRHVVTDEEEMEVFNDHWIDSEEECEEDESVASDSEKDISPTQITTAPLSASPANAPAATTKDDKVQKRREEQLLKRSEEDQLLIDGKKVRDDKGNLLNTIGPFPPPRLVVRSTVPGVSIPSRKSLCQRQSNVNAESSSDESEHEAPSASPPHDEKEDKMAKLSTYLNMLSLDSLKKLGESGKAKINAKASQEEAVEAVVACIIRLGSDKSCLLIGSKLDSSSVHTNRSYLAAQMESGMTEFFTRLPDDTRNAMGTALGITKPEVLVSDMQERVLVLGIEAILANIRPRPLRNIAKELNIVLNDAHSTEKHCERIIFSLYPGERVRLRMAKRAKKAQGVAYSTVESGMRCVGDMGWITFVIHNISSVRKDPDRHYSPEFEFGGLKWSLLCMANKDHLALYLCQTGSVCCKFCVTVTNWLNADNVVRNEGTQKFSSVSAENDWGFNSVISFDRLLNRSNGFVSSQDSIMVQVGIVLVENIKANAITHAKGKEKKKDVAPDVKVDPDLANQLLESERMENRKKQLKTQITKLVKEEDRKRKEHASHSTKLWQGLMDSFNVDKNKILKEQADRERRDAADRARELERKRMSQEQNQEVKRQLERTQEETAAMQQERRDTVQQGKALWKEVEAAKQRIATMLSEIEGCRATVAEQEKAIAVKQREIDDVRLTIQSLSRPTPEPQQTSEDAAEAALLLQVQQSLASIMQ